MSIDDDERDENCGPWFLVAVLLGILLWMVIIGAGILLWRLL